MKKVRLIDVFGPDQKPIRVEVYDLDGAHQFDILWTPHEENTKENREEFRRWIGRVLKQKEMEPVN